MCFDSKNHNYHNVILKTVAFNSAILYLVTIIVELNTMQSILGLR